MRYQSLSIGGQAPETPEHEIERPLRAVAVGSRKRLTATCRTKRGVIDHARFRLATVISQRFPPGEERDVTYRSAKLDRIVQRGSKKKF